MKRVLVLLAALCASSCTELSARWSDHQVFFGSVREPATGASLTTFCAQTTAERSAVIAFSAAPGARVEEEVVLEGRTEKYFGSAPPERDEAFWCSDVAQVYLRPLQPWICLRAADEDPPAAILAVEPRGEIVSNGMSSGYALALEVRRSGVLRVLFDEECLREELGITADAGPDVDGGAPVSWGELSIQ